MAQIDYRALFEVGDKITLNQEFIKEYSELSPSSWQQDCINTQKETGSLTVTSVESNCITIQGTRARWNLTLRSIEIYELTSYIDDIDLLRAFANNQSQQGYKRNLSVPLSSAFSWRRTREGYDFWSRIYRYRGVDPVSSAWQEDKEDTSNQNKQEINQDTNNKIDNSHEIRLQKQKATIIRGKRPKGSRIRSSEHKAAVRSGQISYTPCHC